MFFVRGKPSQNYTGCHRSMVSHNYT